MKKLLAFVVVLVVGFVTGRLSQQQPANAEGAGGQAIPPPPCQDVNGDGESDVSDGIYLLSWLFLGGPAPECAADNGQSSGLLDTGQTTCYSFFDNGGILFWFEAPCDQAECRGQDAQYATGCPMDGRFVDNLDGTVTDLCTGLMWQQDSADVNGDGHISVDRLGGDRVLWCDALAYCEDLDFAGHTDWRSPNVRELESIVDYGRAEPAIDPVFDQVRDWYWSSSSDVGQPVFAWNVDFEFGGVSSDFKDNYYFVRAVRTIQPGE